MNTRIHDRKKKLAKKAKERIDREQQAEKDKLAAMLRGGLKADSIKWKSPTDLFNLPLGKEIELLVSYYQILEAEEQDFLATYPGAEGQSAARWIRMEKGAALDQLAKLRIRQARGDGPVRLPDE